MADRRGVPCREAWRRRGAVARGRLGTAGLRRRGCLPLRRGVDARHPKRCAGEVVPPPRWTTPAGVSGGAERPPSAGHRRAAPSWLSAVAAGGGYPASGAVRAGGVGGVHPRGCRQANWSRRRGGQPPPGCAVVVARGCGGGPGTRTVRVAGRAVRLPPHAYRGGRGVRSTSVRVPDDWARTPASQTAAAAYPSHTLGPSVTPRRVASTQCWISRSYASRKRST